MFIEFNLEGSWKCADIGWWKLQPGDGLLFRPRSGLSFRSGYRKTTISLMTIDGSTVDFMTNVPYLIVARRNHHASIAFVAMSADLKLKNFEFLNSKIGL